MCGRYRRTTSEEELARRYHIPIPPQRDLPISWNIAPTEDVLAIRFNPETKQRSLDALRWGLIPYWAKDPKIMNKTINARVETVDTVLPPSVQETALLDSGDGFYEWKKVLGGKIPYSISMKDDSPFVFAGLWEGWNDPCEWTNGGTPVRSSLANRMSLCGRSIPVRNITGRASRFFVSGRSVANQSEGKFAPERWP